jgi:death-on-curing protein
VTWVFPTVESILLLQAEQIDEFGGLHGIRDLGLLESAVHRAENKVAYDPDATVAQVAASVSYGLIKNHAFLDGNKRIGLVALTWFVTANGLRLNTTAEVATAIVKRVASSEMDEAKWTAWVESVVAPLQGET